MGQGGFRENTGDIWTPERFCHVLTVKKTSLMDMTYFYYNHDAPTQSSLSFISAGSPNSTFVRVFICAACSLFLNKYSMVTIIQVL